MATRYIGLDLHKAYVHGYVFVPGEGGRHFRFDNTPDGWEKFLPTLTAEDQVAVEATSSAFSTDDRVLGRVDKVVVANPLAMRRLGSGRHTDRGDAERLATMLALGTLPTVWVPPHPIRELRRLLKTRERMQNHITRLTNELRAALRSHGMDVYRRGADLRRALRQEDVAALPAADRVIVLSALRRLEFETVEREALEAEIARRVRDLPEVRLLLSITGVSLVTAAQLYATFGDARRFQGPKQVTRYFGLDPSTYQSGERNTHGRISRNGNKLARTALVEAAESVARHDTGHLGGFYRRKALRLGHNKAIVAVAKKLAVIAWRILVTGVPYRAVKEKLFHQKVRLLEKRAGDEPAFWEEVFRRLPTREASTQKRRRSRIAAA